MSSSIRDLQDPGADQTLHNILRALTLNLELRARYRVFEFEAKQDGHPEVAQLFRELWRLENEPITELLDGLRVQLDRVYIPDRKRGLT